MPKSEPKYSLSEIAKIVGIISTVLGAAFGEYKVNEARFDRIEQQLTVLQTIEDTFHSANMQMPNSK